MNDFYRDVWLHNGEVRTVERTTETGMHVRGWGDGYLVWRGHENDWAYLSTPSMGTIRLGGLVCKGNWPLAFGPWAEGAPDTFVYMQHQDSAAHGLMVYDIAGNRAGQVLDAPYAAEGLAEIRPDGLAVMNNDPSRFRTLPNGEFGHNICETQNFICYQFGRDPDYGGSLSLYDKRTGRTKRWLGYTPHPPRLQETPDGRPVVAISGRDTPSFDQVEWAEDFPPLPVILPPVVAQPESPRPMLRGGFGDVIPGSNVGGSGHPLNVIDGPDYIKPYDEPKLRGVIFDPFYTHDHAQIERDRQKCIEISKRTGAPVCVYDDGHPIGHLLGALRAEGVATMTLTQAYPGPDLLDRLEDARLLRDVIVRALYHADQWTDYELAESYRLIDEWLERTDGLFKLKGDLAAGWNRGAPQSPKPWQREYFQARCARTPAYDWSDWPRTVTSKRGRQPEKPSQPIVTTGKTHPPRAAQASAWAAFVRAVLGLFRRRRAS